MGFMYVKFGAMTSNRIAADDNQTPMSKPQFPLEFTEAGGNP